MATATVTIPAILFTKELRNRRRLISCLSVLKFNSPAQSKCYNIFARYSMYYKDISKKCKLFNMIYYNAVFNGNEITGVQPVHSSPEPVETTFREVVFVLCECKIIIRINKLPVFSLTNNLFFPVRLYLEIHVNASCLVLLSLSPASQFCSKFTIVYDIFSTTLKA